MKMGQMVLNKDSNEVKRFIESHGRKVYPKYWMQIL
jgi:hypothetical protein